jgi:ribosomal-protein-alanine N-acetyltransferase
MALLRLDWTRESETRLEGAGVTLRAPRAADHAAWAALRGASRDFLTPWEPQWSPDELSRASFRARLRRYNQDARAGAAAPFFVFRSSDGALVGGVNVSNIRRGVAQDCTIGYWVGQAFARQGLTRAAVRAVLHHCFEDMRLHRVMAACIPENHASRGLLTGVGFSEEGRARDYLNINGAWRDHILLAMVRGDPIR